MPTRAPAAPQRRRQYRIRFILLIPLVAVRLCRTVFDFTGFVLLAAHAPCWAAFHLARALCRAAMKHGLPFARGTKSPLHCKHRPAAFADARNFAS